MAEFSAHRVTVPEPADNRVTISTHVNLYVSTLGDDVLNSGIEEGSPFRTPARAIAWLGDKIITETGFVTVNFKGGIYEIEDELVLDHPNGERVAFIGADPEILLLQEVSYYKTFDISTSGEIFKYYSNGLTHGITMSCVRPSDATAYVEITGSNSISSVCSFNGVGVLIEDYDLVFNDEYNPMYFYASYPYHPRNNIARTSSILGAHVLRGVSGNKLFVESTIRDNWICLPHRVNLTSGGGGWGRFYGNKTMQNIYYWTGYAGGIAADGSLFDSAETVETALYLANINIDGSGIQRGHYLSSVPVGYYGTNATTGVTIGATANFVGATFPTGNASGATRGYIYQGITLPNQNGWFTATGPNGSILNDTLLFGKNYHEHNPVAPYGFSYSSPLSSINTNRITVKLVPTIFRRYGNILRIGGGMRCIKNIFFDGKQMFAHYKLIGSSESGASNKAAVYVVNSRVGEKVTNEPNGLPNGLFSNSGAKDFHVGFYADKGSDALLGKFITSNCSYGIIANNRSNIQTIGSVCTGMGAVGMGALSSSSMIADRCFVSFCGQSHVTIRIKDSGVTLTDSSFIPGQTFGTPEFPNRIRGTVWDWDSKEKTLTIAVRNGLFEGTNPAYQIYFP